jgi:hypothetical protein
MRAWPRLDPEDEIVHDPPTPEAVVAVEGHTVDPPDGLPQ